jgi:hypothetical protein
LYALPDITTIAISTHDSRRRNCSALIVTILAFSSRSIPSSKRLSVM